MRRTIDIEQHSFVSLIEASGQGLEAPFEMALASRAMFEGFKLAFNPTETGICQRRFNLFHEILTLR
jgi:hypothetical protein